MRSTYQIKSHHQQMRRSTRKARLAKWRKELEPPPKEEVKMSDSLKWFFNSLQTQMLGIFSDRVVKSAIRKAQEPVEDKIKVKMKNCEG